MEYNGARRYANEDRCISHRLATRGPCQALTLTLGQDLVGIRLTAYRIQPHCGVRMEVYLP